MKANVFRSAMIARCKAALNQAKSLASEKHAGIKGQLREILASDLFLPSLPPEVRIGSGKLVNHEGKSSPQIDLILYAPAILPPFLFDQKNGYFPAESALYSIEIKSTLTAAELGKSIKNARVTRALPLLGTEHWRGAPEFNPPVASMSSNTPSAINALFAFNTDLKGNKTEIERYFELDDGGIHNPIIQVLCVVGKGYWYSSSQGWKFVAADDDISEVMNFLAGTMNTIPQLIISKGRPRFGNYLTTEKHVPVLIEEAGDGQS